MFGDKLTVYLGTGEKSVYLSVGQDANKLMKELIDAGANDNPGDRPVGQAHIKVLPILELRKALAPTIPWQP